ncbi:hypothetical protein, partial [Actinophytocola sp. NPDC049390]|uniref:deazapurine DNA modification protein DpdA family protein n=1 Tax=Actinophytocola sp. NPDC049390 TaxID=3363894 RepID=UPI00378D173C
PVAPADEQDGVLVLVQRTRSPRCLMRHRVLGNGGFTELSLHGEWRIDAATYVGAVRRYATEIGNLDCAALRDRMTEDHVLARTGLSLRAQQHLTVIDYLRLRDLDPELPFIPVLQGQSITDYHRCADMYEERGVDLAAVPLVGVGSVCRLQHTLEVEQIVRSLAACGYMLHAFGAKVLGLGRYADSISSSDSAAWSYRGRFVPGCNTTHRSESNCLRFALAWRANLLNSPRTEMPDHDAPGKISGWPSSCHSEFPPRIAKDIQFHYGWSTPRPKSPADVHRTARRLSSRSRATNVPGTSGRRPAKRSEFLSLNGSRGSPVRVPDRTVIAWRRDVSREP